VITLLCLTGRISAQIQLALIENYQVSDLG
jgi:hypothetical protein